MSSLLLMLLPTLRVCGTHSHIDLGNEECPSMHARQVFDTLENYQLQTITMGGTKSHICCSLSNQDGGGTVPVLAVDKEVGHTTLSGVRGRTHLSFACLKVEERQTLWTSAVSATGSSPFLVRVGCLCLVLLLCSAS